MSVVSQLCLEDTISQQTSWQSLTILPPHLLPRYLRLMCRGRVVRCIKCGQPLMLRSSLYFDQQQSATPPPQRTHRCTVSPSALPSFSNESKYSEEEKKRVTVFYLIAEH